MMEHWLIATIAGLSAVLVILLVCMVLFIPIFGFDIGNMGRYAQTLPTTQSSNRTRNAQNRSRSATAKGRSTTASRNASKSRPAGTAGKGNKKGGVNGKGKEDWEIDLERGDQIVVEGPSTLGKV